MKRKLALLLALVLAFTTFATGCNKKEEGNTDETQYVEVSSNIDYNVGDVVNVTDLVTLNPEAGEIAQVVVMDETGNVDSVLNTSKEGSFLVTIVIQTTDGKEYSAEYMYNVVSDLLANGCTADIDAKLSGMTTKVYKVNDNLSITLAVPEGWSCASVNTGSTTINDIKVESVAELIDKEYNSSIINYYSAKSEDIVQANSAFYGLFTSVMIMSMDIDKILESEQDEATQAKWSKTVSEFTEKLFTTEAADAGFSVYGLDGTEYKVTRYTTVCNLSMLKSGEAAYPVAYTYAIELPEGSLALTTTLGVDKVIVKGIDVSGISLADGTTMTINGVEITSQDLLDAGATKDEEGMIGFGEEDEVLTLNEDIKVNAIKAADLESVDALREYFNKQFESLGEGPVGAKPVTDDKVQTQTIAENIYIGEYQVVEDVTIEEEDKEESESTEVEDTEEATEEEEKEESGAVSNTAPTYAQRFPDIFKWPGDDTKYRRWVYILNGNFTGSVIKPDGTIIEGDSGTIDITDDETDDEGGGGSNKPSNDAELYTLTSNTANYEISDKDLKEVTFKTSESSSNRLVFEFKGNVYFIELLKSSQVNSYKTNCLYSTSTFKDGKYTVVNGSTKAHKIGQINEYNIEYTDTSANGWVRPYMSVLRTSTDYIVCYGNNLIDVNDTVLTTFLEKMVSEN